MAALTYGSMRWLQVACCAASLLGAAVSCSRKAPEPAAAPDGLARVNGESITEADVQFEIQRRTEANRPLGEASAILQDLIQRKAMLHAAAKSDVLKDPAVRRELENKQLGQWLDRSLQVARDQVSVSDEELRAHYEANGASFTRPEMFRLAILYRQVNPRDPADAEAALRAELEKGRAAYVADPAQATQQGRSIGFGTVAAAYSEDTLSRYRGGDLGWVAADQKNERYPAEIIQAGRALAVGAVSDVLAAGEGLYVVMKADRAAGPDHALRRSRPHASPQVDSRQAGSGGADLRQQRAGRRAD
jgi:parvulin-like peptidyl-prolyl isomerase